MPNGAAQALDLANVPLSGRNAIDASAGTGKTYAISRLYLRLVLESSLQGDEIVDRILVVTFTRPATAELRQRIRDTLVEARSSLAIRAAGGDIAADDPILNGVPEDGLASSIEKLDQALAGFDRAAICTIHSYCQSVLSDHAFEGGRLFQTELETADQAVLREVIDDYWRKYVATATPVFARFVRAESVLRSPAELMDELAPYVGMEDLKILPETASREPTPEVLADAVYALEEAFEAARRSWKEARPAFLNFEPPTEESKGSRLQGLIDGRRVGIEACCSLKRQSFNVTARPKSFALVERTFAEGAPVPVVVPELKILSRTHLEKGIEEGSLPALEVFRRYDDLVAAGKRLRDLEIRLRCHLVGWAASEVRRRRELRGVQSYDDLLQRLLDSLLGPGGDRLAARLRARYPAALIDEFQDTDPVQFRIFDRIYPAGEGVGPLFFVGDPKQAIYGFRRADVFAYIEARTKAQRRYSLGTNRRSTKALVDGVNALFDVAAPFVIDGIPADAVDAIGDEERGTLATPGDDSPPLRLSFFRKCDVAQATRTSVRDTVRRIVALLDDDSAAMIDGGRNPGRIRGGSIAVLVRTNRQAKTIRKALADAGVPSVLAVQSSVFGTDVAADLELVMDAVRDPSDERKMGAAFATALCGVSGEDVDLARHDPGSKAADDWESRVERFRGYNRRWATRGFVEMFRDLLEGEEMASRVLAGPEGERRLTDLLHLGECLGSQSVGGMRRMEALMNWFASSRAEARDESVGDDDERRMRLESDEDLVQVATMHKSKGLEYDIAFLPFAWDSKLRAGDRPSGKKRAQSPPVLFHEPSATGFEARLDLGSEDHSHHRRLARREERAEFLRLFYVGVTRARHRCHVTWGPVKGREGSAPAWLIHRPRLADEVLAPAVPADDSARERAKAELDRLDRIDKALRTRSDDDLWQDLLALQARAPGSIFVEEVRPPEPGSRPRLAAERPPEAPLAPLTWRAEHAPKASRILSFTALASQRGRAVTSAQVAQAAELSETPDHDEGPELPQDDVPAVDELALLPAGRLAGKCLHDIFERLPFDELDPDGDPADLDRVIRPVARESLEAFDVRDASSRVDVVTETVRLTSCADLRLGWRHPEPGSAEHFPPGSPIRLAGLPVERRVRELEFHFPLDSVDGRAFAAAVKMDPLCADVSPALDARLEGYLKGFVDLVFQGDDGCFYVVDYKSNRLGAGISAYGRDAVVADMNRHRYPLQSLIYTLALHRLLERRLGANYDPAKHLGGSFYLYLRAIRRVPGSDGAGIVWLRHDLAALLALDRAVNAGREEGKRA